MRSPCILIASRGIQTTSPCIQIGSPGTQIASPGVQIASQGPQIDFFETHVTHVWYGVAHIGTFWNELRDLLE